MSAPVFLTIEEFLSILISELPEGVYANDLADDPDFDKRSYSSAELRAIASYLAICSNNLNLIYNDKFLSTVTSDGLVQWEKDFFSTAQDSTLSFQVRVQNLTSKIRSTGGISYTAIKSVVAGILGTIPFDLLPYSGQAGVGAWILDESALDYGTWLAELDPLIGARNENGLVPLDCSFDFADEGLTADDLAAIQRTAYMYEVRIYGNASDAILNLLDMRLTQLEPARSSHVIRNNQTYGPSDVTAYLAATPEFDRMRL